MGAWGVGMQANDTALDFIAKYQDFEAKKGLPINRAGKDVVEGKTSFLNALKRVAGKEEDPGHRNMAVLGVAEYLFNHGAVMDDAVKSFVRAAISQQLSDKELGTWGERAGDGGQREQALKRFRDQIDGKGVDPKALAQGNEGLLSKMNRAING